MDWTYYYLRCQEEDLLHFTMKQKTPWTHYFSFFYVFWLKLSFIPTEKIKFESQIQKMTKKSILGLLPFWIPLTRRNFFRKSHSLFENSFFFFFFSKIAYFRKLSFLSIFSFYINFDFTSFNNSFSSSFMNYVENVWALAWWLTDWNGETSSDQWRNTLDSNPLWVEHGDKTTSSSSKGFY